MTKQGGMFELVELDPATGEEDQCFSLAPATWAAAKRHMDQILMDVEEDWNEELTVWPVLMIRPAA